MATIETSTPTNVGMKRKLTTATLDTSPVPHLTSRDKPAKRRKNNKNDSGPDTDSFCWICHKDGDTVNCVTCPRVYHIKCIKPENSPKDEDWMCEECDILMDAENLNSRSRAMRLLTVDQLGVLLKFALGSLRNISGIEPFTRPVDADEFPDYKDYIVNPMDLSTVEKNIRRKQYGSTEAFIGHIKWILHNCIIYNSTASKLTSVAKALVKKCRLEMQEIENCPDCYLNAHTKKDSWFVLACRIPHLLVWAKMTGFPYWPGKVMRVNNENNVDVRFFGAHDKAWLPSKDVFLYSTEAPNSLRQKKRGSNLENCSVEVEVYIKNVIERYGAFEFAPPKTQLDPEREEDQLKVLYPTYIIPFELTRRLRKYSNDSNENCPTTAPNSADEEEKEQSKGASAGQDEREDEVTPMMDEVTPMSSGKLAGNEIIDDELMASGEEDLLKEQDTSSECQKETIPALKISKGEKILTLADTIKIKAPDRTVESPPCEVSSTTAAEVEKPSASNVGLCEGEDKTKKDDTDSKSDIESISDSPDEQDVASKYNGSFSPTPKGLDNPEAKDDAISASDDDSEFISKQSFKYNSDGTGSLPEESETSPGKMSGEIDDDDELGEMDSVKPDEESNASPVFATSASNQRPNFEAAVIAEPDAIALADAIVDTHSLTETEVATVVAIDPELDDDEVDEISEDEEPTSVENNGALTEEEQAEPMLVDSVRSGNIPRVNATRGMNAENKGKNLEDETSPEDDAEEAEIDDVEPDTMYIDEDNIADNNEDVEEEDEDEEEEEEGDEEVDGEGDGEGDGDGDVEEDEEEDEEEEIVEPKHDEVDTSRLLASGVSVTIVERPSAQKQSPEKAPETSAEPAPASKVTADIGLGSDVSVTLVQKKKNEAPVASAESTQAPPAGNADGARKGMISVKNHRELLQDPTTAKDIVQIQNVMSNISKTRKPFPSKSGDPASNPIAALAAVAASKVPPDPVVTISKVNTNTTKENLGSGSTLLNTLTRGTPGQNILNRGATAVAPPAVSSPLNIPDASPMGRSTMPSVSPIGPLASLLGAPRISGTPYRPGVPQPPIRPNASNSPLLRMAATVGPTSRGSPHQPATSLPSLHPRPSFPPPGAGPVSEQLNKAVAKMTDYMRFSLEEVLKDVANQGSPEAMVKLLQIEMERMQYRHQQEMNDVKQNYDLLLLEVRQNAETERQKCAAELKKQFEVEKQKVVNETKKKQWCAQCGKEAIFYCCWNTSYCDYPCQQKHWPSHMNTCAQNQSNQDDDSAGGSGNDSHLEALEHSGAASHFLGQVMKQANSRNQANGLLSNNRGFPGGPSAMSFNPAALNLNPRMASQLSMRYAAAAVAAQNHPRFPAQLRFPGSYFM